jgi:hypothetical protein
LIDRPRAIALAVVLAALAIPATATAAPTRPDADTQPLEDGCQRSPGPFIVEAEAGVPGTPEWAYVYRDPTVRVAQGVATNTRIGPGDLPNDHVTYDLSSNIDVVPRDAYLLAGDPSTKTGNFGGDDESTGRLHVEWEYGDVPRFAWPTENDRVKLWGSWVWDCGHWGQGFSSDPNDPTATLINDVDFFLPGEGELEGDQGLRGEQTEFHPMRAMVITRDHPYLPKGRASETDAFISSQGTEAHTEEECARKHPAAPGTLEYPPSYANCVLFGSTRQPANDRNYRFFVPAPPKPFPRARLAYRVEQRIAGNAPRERIEVGRRGLRVTVPFKGFHGDGGPLEYGKSFFVRWRHDPRPRPTRLQVHLGKLTINHSLDPNPNQPFQLAPPPGEYGVYLDVNGYWKYLNDWAPGLAAVNDGDSFDLGHTIGIRVPRGRGLRVFVMSRECDLPTIKPCPSPGETATDNDDPGLALDVFRSAAQALGSHELHSDTNDNYVLDYRVSRAGP